MLRFSASLNNSALRMIKSHMALHMTLCVLPVEYWITRVAVLVSVVINFNLAPATEAPDDQDANNREFDNPPPSAPDIITIGK